MEEEKIYSTQHAMRHKNSATSSPQVLPGLSNLYNLGALLCNFDECSSRVTHFSHPSPFPWKNHARVKLGCVCYPCSIAEHRQNGEKIKRCETSLTLRDD